MRNLYCRPHPAFASPLAIPAFAAAALILAPAGSAQAAVLNTLHSLCTSGGSTYPDGSLPGGGLLLDSSGDIWGTTFYGGKNNGSGTVFRLQP